MNTVLIGVLSFVLLLILVFLHMPISIVMVFVSTIGYALLSTTSCLIKLGTDTFNNAAVYTPCYPHVPLMGLFLGTSVRRRLFDAFNAWFDMSAAALPLHDYCSAFFPPFRLQHRHCSNNRQSSLPEMRTHKYKDTLAAAAWRRRHTDFNPPSSLGSFMALLRRNLSETANRGDPLDCNRLLLALPLATGE